MKLTPPEVIAINHDDYHAQHVGFTKDGFQFFLTTPFEPEIDGGDGGEYIALFKFDKKGNLVSHNIESFGPRNTVDYDMVSKTYDSILESLGEIEFCRIEVKPFSVTFNNVQFGLVVREPEDEEDIYAVELLPGNYMAFFEPWDSGEYDT